MLANRANVDMTRIWNSINGIVNIYKPAGISAVQTKYTVINKLCQELNQLTPPSEIRPSIQITTTFGQKLSVKYDTVCSRNTAIGDIYQVDDFKHKLMPKLGNRTSGVLVLGLNAGVSQLHRILNNKPIGVYHITGRFGTATENNFPDARVIHRATFKHVRHNRISDLVSSMQAAHQRKMYDLCGVDIQSQTAYELAIRGIIRPVNYEMPLLYGIKCISYESPDFVLEVHCLNENESYFGILVQEIGLQLHTVAHCSKLKCIRCGPFEINDALLKKDWQLDSILSSINSYKNILADYPKLN